MTDHQERSDEVGEELEAQRRRVGLAIKAGRVAKNLTQYELAPRIGVKQPALSAWEAGKAWPTVPNLFLLAKVLELDIDELLNPADPEPEEGEPMIVDVVLDGATVAEAVAS